MWLKFFKRTCGLLPTSDLHCKQAEKVTHTRLNKPIQAYTRRRFFSRLALAKMPHHATHPSSTRRMKSIPLLISACLLSAGYAQDTGLNIQRDIPYTEPADPLQSLDVYGPSGAKNLPVVVWIHGGGWQQGDK